VLVQTRNDGFNDRLQPSIKYFDLFPFHAHIATTACCEVSAVTNTVSLAPSVVATITITTCYVGFTTEPLIEILVLYLYNEQFLLLIDERSRKGPGIYLRFTTEP
jgi:hypothetical protein